MSFECFFLPSHTNLVLSVFTTSPERQLYISNVFSAARRELKYCGIIGKLTNFVATVVNMYALDIIIIQNHKIKNLSTSRNR